jgi:hypothetical protein
MPIYFNPYNSAKGHCPKHLEEQADKLMRYLRRNVKAEELTTFLGVTLPTVNRWYLRSGRPGSIHLPKLLEKYAIYLDAQQ